MSDKYKTTRNLVKELGLEILNSEEGFIIKSVDEYLTSIKSNTERKPSNHINRAIEEYINKVGPADYYFKVDGVNGGKDLKFSLIQKEPWVLKND